MWSADIQVDSDDIYEAHQDKCSIQFNASLSCQRTNYIWTSFHFKLSRAYTFVFPNETLYRLSPNSHTLTLSCAQQQRFSCSKAAL